MENTNQTQLTDLLDIQYPIIMAPMFLVTNVDMMVAACEAGITGAIPALNFRTIDELKAGIQEIKSRTTKPFGINLIVNQSNIHYADQLEVCLDLKVDFLITSLGSPQDAIQKAHEKGILVFCDVTTLAYALKVEKHGADALIAVNKEAGGHAGNISRLALIDELRSNCAIPVLSAGGVGDSKGVKETLNHGAAGLSIGSLFIASTEATVSEEYKQACIDYGQNDIVLTTKLSGTPCTVINTPYVKEVGTEQSGLEKFLNRNKRLKKWVKALTFLKGMKTLQKAAFGQTYKNVWCAGPSIEHVKSVKSIKEIVEDLVVDLQ